MEQDQLQGPLGMKPLQTVLDRLQNLAQVEDYSYGGTSLIRRRSYPSGLKTIEKVLLPKFRSRPDYENLLAREFEILKSISHPFIVKAFGHQPSTSKKASCLEMEYVPGVRFADLEPGLSLLEASARKLWALEFLNQISAAIEFLHEKNIIHGDLCPENILIDENGFIRVIDFATAQHPLISAHKFLIQGKQVFRAPELRKSGASSKAGDIFAVGKLFEAAAGDSLDEEGNVILSKLCEKREFMGPPYFEGAWFKGLPALKISNQGSQGVKREKTLLLRPQSWRFSLSVGGLLLVGALMSSWLPLRGRISVNALPYSTKMTVEALGSSIWWDRPLRDVSIAAGKTRVTFVIPTQKNRVVHRDVLILPGESLKVFEDFLKN